MAGARVVPIPYDASVHELNTIFDGINGILFPGGEVDFEKDGKPTLFASNAKYLLNKAMNATNNGVYFPIWGTCLGFELLHYIVAGNYSILHDITNEVH